MELSPEAKQRLRMMEWCDQHGSNASLTCRRFDISRDTFYRWRRRYSLRAGWSGGRYPPAEARTPTWSKELEDAVLELRRLTPGWGKDKLVVLLKAQGWDVSASFVGRILRHLKVSGRLVEAPAAGFLDTIVARMPFPVRAIQVDGGSEFMAEFEEACRARGILPFVLPPRSPKLNGHVERSNRTHREEFYCRLPHTDTLALVNRRLRKWEELHNTYRPHQALGQLTPLVFHQKCAKKGGSGVQRPLDEHNEIDISHSA